MFFQVCLIGQQTLFFIVILKLVVYKSLSINVLCGYVFLGCSVCLLSTVLFFRDDATNASSCSQASSCSFVVSIISMCSAILFSVQYCAQDASLVQSRCDKNLIIFSGAGFLILLCLLCFFVVWFTLMALIKWSIMRCPWQHFFCSWLICLVTPVSHPNWGHSTNLQFSVRFCFLFIIIFLFLFPLTVSVSSSCRFSF